MSDTDSRRAAFRYYRKKAVHHLFSTSTFVGNLLLALALSYFIDIPHATPAMECVLFLLIFSVGLWLTEAIPPFAVGIFVIAFLVVALGSEYFMEVPVDPDRYLSTWTSDVIWLLLGGFFLAEGMKSVQLDRALFLFAVRQPAHVRFTEVDAHPHRHHRR